MNNDDQIKKIQEIMGKPDFPYYKITFGKYKNKTLEYVYKNDKPYLFWLYNNVDDLPKTLEGLLQSHVILS